MISNAPFSRVPLTQLEPVKCTNGGRDGKEWREGSIA
jgi:hypothetical protein